MKEIQELKELLDNIIKKNCIFFEYDFHYQKNVEKFLPDGWTMESYYNSMYFIHQFLYHEYKDFIYKKETENEYSEKWYIRYKNKMFVAEYFCAYGGEDFYIREDNDITVEKIIVL